MKLCNPSVILPSPIDGNHIGELLRSKVIFLEKLNEKNKLLNPLRRVQPIWQVTESFSLDGPERSP
jgi:hypothetical protein